MPISSKLPLKKNINTVHNLITFSIVFTNKNRAEKTLSFFSCLKNFSYWFQMSRVFGNFEGSMALVLDGCSKHLAHESENNQFDGCCRCKINCLTLKYCFTPHVCKVF